MPVSDCTVEDIRVIGNAVGLAAAAPQDLRTSLQVLEGAGVLTLEVEERQIRLRLRDEEGAELLLARRGRQASQARDCPSAQ